MHPSQETLDLETSVFKGFFLECRPIMQKNHACEEKYSKCTKEQTLSNICKFVRLSTIIVLLKIKHDVWQPMFDQPLQTNP